MVLALKLPLRSIYYNHLTSLNVMLLLNIVLYIVPLVMKQHELEMKSRIICSVALPTRLLFVIVHNDMVHIFLCD